MKLHKDDDVAGPPCKHMEQHLNRAADGTAVPLQKWYALAHAARCGRCGRLLASLRESLTRLRETRKSEPSPEVLARLAAGSWRDSAGHPKKK